MGELTLAGQPVDPLLLPAMIMMLQSMSMIMPIEDQTCDGPVVKTSRAKRASSAKAKKRIVRNVDPPKFSEQRGFAIGSAVLVSLALFGAYVSRATISTVDVLTPKVFIGLLVGAVLPYWFSAMTVKSVGSAALKMVEEVRRKFNTIPGLMEGLAKPDYATCVKISTDASIKEMIPPGAPLAVLKF